MSHSLVDRRRFIKVAGTAAGAAALSNLAPQAATQMDAPAADKDRGSQRMSLERLRQFEALGYGMFISYDIQAFHRGPVHARPTDEKRRLPANLYAPDKLDVSQWIGVARDAGMKYAVLTAKRHPGFCLWPSKYTDFTVANSGNKTDVVEKFVQACDKFGVRPGLYYPSVDIHHLGGRRPEDDWKYTTSIHQTFMTNQITELLTRYGAIDEMWIDIPQVLGRGYRTFLYGHIARLQPNAVIMMNNAKFGDGSGFAEQLDLVWPTDLIAIETPMPPPTDPAAIEKNLPPESGHKKWRTIEGKSFYLPGEVSGPAMETWWWGEDTKIRPDEALATTLRLCRERGVNYLLDAPPDNHGLIPRTTVDALMRLRRNVGI